MTGRRWGGARQCGALAAALAAAALFACSSTPRASAMSVRDPVPARSRDARLALHVEGGGAAEYQVHDAAFVSAVTESLAAAKAFSALVEGPRADYRLDVRLGDLRQPVLGGNEPTMMTVLWSLSRADSGETVWQELVRTSGISHNVVAVWRLRGGAENAARENIREALRRLADAPL